MLLHDKQKLIVASKSRYKTIRAGRKAGKTALEVEVIVFKATISAKKLKLNKTEFATIRKVLYIAPTQKQAREIVWEALKTRVANVGIPNEQRLEMKLPNEDGTFSLICVGGWENRENYRGLTDVIHITFDETDTLQNFFTFWKEIFRPLFLDTGGTADFVGTPKKENPNLKRLEKEFQAMGESHESFHFTSKDNPFISINELESIEKEYAGDRMTYQQEILAEYVDNQGSLFKYDALVDVFSNTVTKNGDKYLLVDIADDGSDKTIFSFWESLEEYKREEYAQLNTESIIMKIKEYASQDRIPYSHIAVDAIGVGAGVASSSQLDGIIGYKSSYSAIKTDDDIVRVPGVGYLPKSPILTSDYRNLRSQCIFVLAELVNSHKIASRCVGRQKEVILEELSNYQDTSTGDGKRQATQKEDIKEAIGRSPDASDCWLMRQYFTVREKVSPNTTEQQAKVQTALKNQFSLRKSSYEGNSTK